MPVNSPQSAQSLIMIAKNTNLSIHERLEKIKGDDNCISSKAEAEAILAIPYEKQSFWEDREELPIAKLYAQSYIKYDGKNLLDNLIDLFKFCLKQGKKLYADIIEE